MASNIFVMQYRGLDVWLRDDGFYYYEDADGSRNYDKNLDELKFLMDQEDVTDSDESDDDDYIDDDSYDEFDDDGQPSEMQEWHDYDEDC